MNNLKRIGLDDLQDLAQSFANLNMVDQKMNEVTPQGGPPLNKTEGFQGEYQAHYTAETSRRARRRRPKMQDTPVGKAALEPIYPYGVTLNLDDAEFKDRESLIDDWGVFMKITASTLELDKESFIRTIKLSLADIVKESIENTTKKEMNKIWGRKEEKENKQGDNKDEVMKDKDEDEEEEDLNLGNLVERFVRALKRYFLGEGYFGNSNEEKARIYLLAFYNLRLVILRQDTLSKFLKLFTLYFHKSRVDHELGK